MSETKDGPPRLRYGDVLDQLGRALFPDDWPPVAKLTVRERWLAEHGNSSLRNDPASIMPSMVVYTTAGGPPDFASSPDPEYREARKKYEFRKHLVRQIDEWLDGHGVDVSDDGRWVDSSQFYRAYAAAFPQLALPTDRRSPSPAALREAFQAWAGHEREADRIVTESAARKALDVQFGEGTVSREAIRRLIENLPADQRAPRHRPAKPRAR